jgi:hypothetical protein
VTFVKKLYDKAFGRNDFSYKRHFCIFVRLRERRIQGA